MATVYLMTLCLGILYAFASFMIGKNKHVVASVGSQSSSLFNPKIVALFMIAFGLSGMITLRLNWSLISVFFISLCFGLFVSVSLYMGVLQPLRKLQKESLRVQNALIGCEALVTASILSGALGTISYQFNENTYNGSAKTEAGTSLNQGEKVRIVRFEGNDCVVEKIDV